MNDNMMRYVLIGIVARLKELTSTIYRVPMKSVSDAYADDYYELMVMNRDIKKAISEIERLMYNDDNT